MKLLRRLVDGSSGLLGRIKRNQRITIANGSPVKANLGCGLAIAPGWINIDGSLNALVATFPKWAHGVAYNLTGSRNYYSKEEYICLLGENRFVHHDLAYGLPIQDGVVDYLYTSHFLEHLFRRDAEYLLQECFRVLKPGGVLRISIPDLEYAISLYRKGDKEKMLTSFFFVDDDDSYYARHKYMYDFDMISDVLNGIGFIRVSRCEYKNGNTPDIDILDNRPEESVYVEAIR